MVGNVQGFEQTFSRPQILRYPRRTSVCILNPMLHANTKCAMLNFQQNCGQRRISFEVWLLAILLIIQDNFSVFHGSRIANRGTWSKSSFVNSPWWKLGMVYLAPLWGSGFMLQHKLKADLQQSLPRAMEKVTFQKNLAQILKQGLWRVLMELSDTQTYYTYFTRG